MIITNYRYKETIAEQIPEMPKENILMEPNDKNTAPCIAYGAYKIYAKNPDSRLIMVPSDHVILKEDLFTEVVEAGFKFAKNNDMLFTIGIKPHKPEIGYGYIHSNMGIIRSNQEKWQLSTFSKFTEKPDRETAELFLESGEYFWNAGIFIWSLKAILSAFQTHLPEMTQLFDRYMDTFNTEDEPDTICQIYYDCDNLSIDYGIIENAKNVKIISTDIGWSDLGTWSSLLELSEKDEKGNTVFNSR